MVARVVVVHIVRGRARVQRHDRVHVVHVRTDLLRECDRDELVTRRHGAVRRPADGRRGHGRHRRDIGQRGQLLHRPVRPSQDLALVR